LKEIRFDQSSLDAFKLVLETVRSEALGTAFIQIPSVLGKQSPAIAAGTGEISVDASIRKLEMSDPKMTSFSSAGVLMYRFVRGELKVLIGVEHSIGEGSALEKKVR
jgi:hypothetical protein